MVQENSLKKVLVICGPTASGKTGLAVECARMMGGEVVSADSMYIYKECDIGTAKPTEEEKKGVPHHMIDVVGPSDTFSVGDYRDMALPIVEDILSRGKIPIICGGTGFYINSILYDLSYGKAACNEGVRDKWENFLLKNGKESLHAELELRDKESADKLHVNDTRRVIRALEIFEVSGQKKSEIIDDFIPRYDYRSFAVSYPREELYERINKRVDVMMNDGLIEEINKLFGLGVERDDQCMQGIGYKEVCQGLDEGMTKEEIAELIKFNTRHYAKRQITFFKRDPRLVLLDKAPVEDLAKEVCEKFESIKYVRNN